MEWYEELKRKEYVMNREENTVMWVSKQDRCNKLDIECDGNTLEKIETFECLGTLI